MSELTNVLKQIISTDTDEDKCNNIIKNMINKYDSDPTDILNENFKCVDINNIKMWNTPFGVTFINRRKEDYVEWIYEYNITDGVLCPLGTITGTDIINVVQQAIKNPDILRKKPKSIEKLEELTGVKAFRKNGTIGAWHIRKDDDFSLFNNPFNIIGSHANSVDNFEIWIRSESVPRDYVSIADVIKLLEEHGFLLNKDAKHNNKETPIKETPIKEKKD